MNTDTPLLTDLYQLTMAAGYWKSGKAEQEAVFHLFFRKLPFAGGYAIAAGLAEVVRWFEALHFAQSELDYLGTLVGRDGKNLFEKAFLGYLGAMRWRCDVDAIPEGTVVFPHEPLLRIKGPLIQAQLVETAVLNLINFQTLIATKAARICEAAKGEPVLEFGLRRAHGPHAAVLASRAAFIGGCAATSNVLAGMEYGIPVRGTHAHSWVMAFDTELEAFAAYADAMPNNCVFLVDTYDTLQGVRHAVEIGKRLREHGHEMAGIRLDSGDLAWLSIEARQILDQAGFKNVCIVATNDLDEHLIESLKHQGAAITVWGVGTNLVTGGDQSALGGVYKLGAIRNEAGVWHPKIKLSEQTAKISNPGIQQVRRFTLNGEFVGDAIFDEEQGCPTPTEIIHPVDPHRSKTVPANATFADLLKPVMREGKSVGKMLSLREIQAGCHEQLKHLNAAIKRLDNPHAYPAGIERTLFDQKLAMIVAAKSSPGL